MGVRRKAGSYESMLLTDDNGLGYDAPRMIVSPPRVYSSSFARWDVLLGKGEARCDDVMGVVCGVCGATERGEETTTESERKRERDE